MILHFYILKHKYSFRNIKFLGTRKKQISVIDTEIMKCLETLSSPREVQSVPVSSSEQFGIFIGKELEKVENDYIRMDVQMKIMKLAQDAICR